MNKQTVDALQDCLERMEAGATPAQALSRYPELRRELEPRLASAMTLRARRPGPPPSFDPRMRERLREVDAERSVAVVQLLRWQPVLLRAAAVLLAIGLSAGSGQLALAALADLPADHWLKPVAVRVDRVRAVVLEYVEVPLPGAIREPVEAPQGLNPGAEQAILDMADPVEVPEPRESMSESSLDDGSAGNKDWREDRDRPVSRDGDVSNLLAAQASATEASASASAVAEGLSPLVPSAATPTVAAAGSGQIVLLPSTATPVSAIIVPPPREPPPPGSEEPRQPNPVIPEDPPSPEEPTSEPSPRPTSLDHTPIPPPTRGPTAAPGSNIGAISGKVSFKNSERKLRAPVEVSVIRADGCGRPGRGRPPQFVAQVRTDGEGRYRIDALPVGEYRVGVLGGNEGGGIPIGTTWHDSESRCEDSDVVRVTGGSDLSDINVRLRNGGDGEDGGSPGDSLGRPDRP